MTSHHAKLYSLSLSIHIAQQVFWHSTAHVLGEAAERIYGGHLCYGPPIKDGFYYDIYICNECHPDVNKENSDKQQSNDVYVPPNTVSKAHFNTIESLMKTICNERQPFERLLLSKQELIDLLSYNKFKVRIINERIQEDFTTAYRCGTLIDLCRGPHVRNTGYIKALHVTKASSSYWEGRFFSYIIYFMMIFIQIFVSILTLFFCKQAKRMLNLCSESTVFHFRKLNN